ncbi:MAG: TlpA family protein disulfide reductase [Gammaproteobacteria bacterium]|nr:TlpA family protein disulfide reductase [Gammaproteobacteria bacterium]
MTRFLSILTLALLFWQPLNASERSIELEDGSDLPYQDLKANSDILYLLLPLEFGMHQTNAELGRQMQRAGLHTWVVDLLSPSFLPISTASMDEIPAEHVSAMIKQALKETRKDVVLIAIGRTAIPALRGGHHWLQQNEDHTRLKGLLLVHPKLYTATPQAGERPDYMPVVSANQLPIYLLNPTQSPSRWRVLDDSKALSQQGAEVFIKLLPGVRNFYFRNPNPSALEVKMSQQFPATLEQGARLLARLEIPVIDKLVALPKESKRAKPRLRKIENYAGNPLAPALSFPDTNGVQQTLADYQGKVVLLNFWATWCPPCVHEMPSMDRLQDSLKGQPFTILAVNMAEEAETVRTFLKRDVKVNFPVLLDSKGLALKDWDVFVYPTSYIIDKQGRIRSAMYGAIDWDTDEVRAQMQALINE